MRRSIVVFHGSSFENCGGMGQRSTPVDGTREQCIAVRSLGNNNNNNNNNNTQGADAVQAGETRELPRLAALYHAPRNATVCHPPPHRHPGG
jgi:hypothetical protein